MGRKRKVVKRRGRQFRIWKGSTHIRVNPAFAKFIIRIQARRLSFGKRPLTAGEIQIRIISKLDNERALNEIAR